MVENTAVLQAVPQNDFDNSKTEAVKMLKQLLPPQVWTEFEKTGKIRVIGKNRVYLINLYSQTEIFYLKSRQFCSFSCVQCSSWVTKYHRVLGEYFLIKNHEDIYRKTANFFHNEENIGIGTLIFISLDLALLFNLLISWLRL